MDIATALSSATAAIGLAKDALAARDDAKLRSAVTTLEARLGEVTSTALASAVEAVALQAALVQLQGEKRDLERRLEDRAMYRLHELRPGAFAYASQPGLEGVDAPQHYLCQPCFDRGQKAALRYHAGNEWTHGKWLCPESNRHAIDDTQDRTP